MRYFLKNILLQSLILTIFLVQPGQAQKFTSEFLSIGVGARALAMGGAFVALADDGSSVFWNPAGLSQLTKRELSFMHASQFSGLVHSNFFSFAYPDLNGNAFAVSYFRLGIDDIPKSTKLDQYDRPIIEGYLQDTEQSVFISFSHQTTKRFYLGSNIKIVRQNIGDNASLGFGCDVGLLYRFSHYFSGGLNFQDIAGTYVFWDTGKKDIRTPTAKWGFGLSKSIPSLSCDITFALDQNIRFEGKNSEQAFSIGEFAGADFQLGGELLFLNLLALRAGLERSHLTAGTGFKLKFAEIDYAFVSYDLGNTHRISGRILF